MRVPTACAFESRLRAIEVPAMRLPQVMMIAGLSLLRRLAIDPSHNDNKVFGRKGTSRGKCRSHQDGLLMISTRLLWFVMSAEINASPSAIPCSRMPAVPSLITQIWEFSPLVSVVLPEEGKGVDAGKAMSPSWSV